MAAAVHSDAEPLGPNLVRTGGPISAFVPGGGVPTRLGITNFIHAITPETPTTTHWVVMKTRDFGLDDRAD